MKEHTPQKEKRSAAPFIPNRPTLQKITQTIDQCRGCDLYKYATQGVPGEGSRTAHIVFVGEQPGDKEDQEGRPFVGPAGALLDRALAEARIDRKLVYVTNAVKHFKFEKRGKRRIHQKPNLTQINACRPWLDTELSLLKPKLIVTLGATAAQSLMGPSFRLTNHRGEFFNYQNAELLATIHPSAILRAPDPVEREAQYKAFVKDLLLIKKQLSNSVG